MTFPIIRARKPLKHWNSCLEQGAITIGFLGGSITDARPRHNWPEYVREWLLATYSNVRLRIENAAIGATGSDLAALRVKRDIIDRNCDVVFIEYAVNDHDVPSYRRRRTREGLIRQLYKAGVTELIFVYTYSGEMKEEIDKGRYPASIAELEELAIHYHIPSIWVGKYGLDQVAAGKLSMDEWLPDGLHPKERGSRIYAECVIEYLQRELQGQETLDRKHIKHDAVAIQPEQLLYEPVTDTSEVERSKGSLLQILQQPDASKLPRALDPLCWEYIVEIPLSELELKGQWVEQRWHQYEWIDTMLETNELGASLYYSFRGRGLMLVFDYGSCSAEFEYRIDDGEWIYSNRDCPEWVGHDGWLRLFDFGDELTNEEHRIELRVVKPRHERQELGEYIFRLGKVAIIL